MTDHIFISYSKRDSDFALKLAEDLQEAGFKIWIDRTIGGGDKWRETIEKNLKAAEEVIIVVSPNSMASEWVRHEGSAAYAWGKRLLPILIGPVDSLPPWLEEYQWIDFVDQPYDVAFDALIEDLTPPNAIQDLLDQQLKAYQTTGELMGESILKVIDENIKSLEIDEFAIDFLQKSRKTIQNRKKNIEQKNLQLKKRMSYLLLALTLATLATIVAIIFGFQSRYQARIARSGELFALALRELDDQIDIAYLLSVEARKLIESEYSRKALIEILSYNPYSDSYLYGHENEITSFDISPDGKYIATGSCIEASESIYCDRGEVKLWDTINQTSRGRTFYAHVDFVKVIRYSSKGNLLASGGCGKK